MASRPVLSLPERKPAADLLVNPKLRSYVDGRMKIMQGTRSDIDPIVEEISQLTQPGRSRFMPTSNGNGRSTADRRKRAYSRKLQDGHGTRAARILTNGMNSGLSSPSAEWFALKIGEGDEDFPTKMWLGQVQAIMYAFLSGTNFYEAAKSGYGELGLFGTEACYLESHWKHGLVCHPLTFGEYWIAEGGDRRVDTLLRSVPLTTRQMVERFVADSFDSSVLHWERVSQTVHSAWDAGNYETPFEIMHLSEPNPAWDGQRKDFAGKPWRSVYWDPRSDVDGRMLGVEGCVEQPFYAARWETMGGGDPWGTGPGFDALADLRALQLDAKRLNDGKDYALKPPLMGPGSVKVKLQPGSYTATSSLDRDAVKQVYTVPYQALELIEQSIARYYRKVDESFSVDLFMAITDMDGVQPRNNEEIFSRNEEKLTQLGPVITRVNVEKLGVVVDRVFGICDRMGLFPDPPQDIHGSEIKIDYVSTLARAQKAVGLSVVERSLGFTGNLKGAFPDITDNIDSDQIIRTYWERTGAPLDGLRDPKAVAGIRAERQQQIAAAQARESAPAAKDGAAAAELLSRTDVRPGSMLDRMTGQQGGL